MRGPGDSGWSEAPAGAESSSPSGLRGGCAWALATVTAPARSSLEAVSSALCDRKRRETRSGSKSPLCPGFRRMLGPRGQAPLPGRGPRQSRRDEGKEAAPPSKAQLQPEVSLSSSRPSLGSVWGVEAPRHLEQLGAGAQRSLSTPLPLALFLHVGPVPSNWDPRAPGTTQPRHEGKEYPKMVWGQCLQEAPLDSGCSPRPRPLPPSSSLHPLPSPLMA